MHKSAGRRNIEKLELPELPEQVEATAAKITYGGKTRAHVNVYAPPDCPGLQISKLLEITNGPRAVIGDFNAEHENWWAPAAKGPPGSLRRRQGNHLAACAQLASLVALNEVHTTPHGPTLDLTLTTEDMVGRHEVLSGMPFSNAHFPILLDLQAAEPDSPATFRNLFANVTEESFAQVFGETMAEAGIECDEIARLPPGDLLAILREGIMQTSKALVPRARKKPRFFAGQRLQDLEKKEYPYACPPRKGLERIKNEIFRERLATVNARTNPKAVFRLAKDAASDQITSDSLYEGPQGPREFAEEMLLKFRHGARGQDVETALLMKRIAAGELGKAMRGAETPGEISAAEILREPHSLEEKRGGPDGIEAKQVKWLRGSETAAKLLTLLANAIVRAGKIPTGFQLATIKPLVKADLVP